MVAYRFGVNNFWYKMYNFMVKSIMNFRLNGDNFDIICHIVIKWGADVYAISTRRANRFISEHMFVSNSDVPGYKSSLISGKFCNYEKKTVFLK